MRVNGGWEKRVMNQQSDLDHYEEVINEQVPRLTTYIRRELAYFVATGDVEPDQLRDDEVIDDVVMRALASHETRPLNLPLDRWLISLANEALNEQVNQTQTRHEEAEREQESVEQEVPPIPPEQAGSAVEDEMYYWYQPDEDLRVEDVVADPHSPSPEEITDQRALLEDIEQAVAYLPKPWRDVFVLHSLEDFTFEEVSSVMGRSLDEVRRDFQSACEFLRERLGRTQAALAREHGGRASGAGGQ
jgi:RNA polymerase sigma factor (sigma-70 family)